MVYGKAGLGKTVALLKIASETCAPLFEVNDTNKGTSAMLEAFITAFGYEPHGRTTRDLLYQCKKVAALDSFALQYGSRGLSPDQYRQSRILLVDEYQNLQPVALRLLLGICLEAQLPLLVCGNSETLLSRSREAKLAMEQLRQRLLLRFEVGKPSYRDCRDIGITVRMSRARKPMPPSPPMAAEPAFANWLTCCRKPQSSPAAKAASNARRLKPP